jgi:hypothetical protein
MKKIIIIFSILIGLILIADGFLYFTFKNHSQDKYKFAEEYNINEDNVFVYSNANEVYKILKDSDGIILFGELNNKWISPYASILNEVAKEMEINKIYYLDINNINDKYYDQIISLLGNNLLSDENGNSILSAPTLTVVLDGIVIGNNNLTSLETGNPDDYWSETKKEEFKNTIERLLNPYVYETCITCR